MNKNQQEDHINIGKNKSPSKQEKGMSAKCAIGKQQLISRRNTSNLELNTLKQQYYKFECEDQQFTTPLNLEQPDTQDAIMNEFRFNQIRTRKQIQQASQELDIGMFLRKNQGYEPSNFRRSELSESGGFLQLKAKIDNFNKEKQKTAETEEIKSQCSKKAICSTSFKSEEEKVPLTTTDQEMLWTEISHKIDKTNKCMIKPLEQKALKKLLTSVKTTSRKDSLLKTIVRDMRKKFKSEFLRLTKYNRKKKKQPCQYLLICLKNYIVDYIIQDIQIDSADQEIIDELSLFLGSMFYPKKLIRGYPAQFKEKILQINNFFQAFSFEKLQAISEQPAFCLLMNIYIMNVDNETRESPDYSDEDEKMEGMKVLHSKLKEIFSDKGLNTLK